MVLLTSLFIRYFEVKKLITGLIESVNTVKRYGYIYRMCLTLFLLTRTFYVLSIHQVCNQWGSEQKCIHFRN